MRYIYYIIGILIVLSLAAGLFLRYDPVRGETFLTVNQRTFSQQEFTQLQQSPAFRHLKQEELLDDLVMRELLLQQARARHLDRKPEFLRAIRNHYEQTLVKTLLEDQINKLELQIDSAQVTGYRSCLGQSYRLKLQPTADSAGGAQEIVGDFIDLPTVLQQQLVEFDEQRPTTTFYFAGNQVQLKILARRPVPQPPQLSDQEIRSTLSDALRQQALNGWLAELRSAADVKIAAPPEGEGDRS